MMKESKSMREIHEIMEKIYEEEKNLSMEEKIRRIKAESVEFMKKHNLKLRRMEEKPVKEAVGV